MGDDDDDEVVVGVHDVGHLSGDDRRRLVVMLEGYGVRGRLVGTELQAPAAEAELIDDLIQHVAVAGDGRPEPPPRHGRSAADPESPLANALAPRWRRLAGFLVEYAAVAAVTIPVAGTLGSTAGRLVAAAFWVLSGLFLVAVTGRTVGMWLLGMRIVVPPSVTVPRWPTAVIRFAVANGPALVGLLLEPVTSSSVLGWLGVADSVWLLLCYGAILIDPYCRGLHDRVAGTFVVSADAVGPLTGARPAA